ncbi:MAG: putative membrane protein YdjX (TVP38/TMEM64 family) [Candidatus Azotimanducaceae bacterium]
MPSGLVAAIAVAWYFDLLDYLTIERLREFKGLLGPWAPIAFLVAFAIGELLQIPSVFWVLCAGLIWPWWFALPLSLFAALLAATVAFLVARHVLGDRFHEKLPKGFDALNKGLRESPFKAVVMIRLTTFLHPVVHWVLAASPVPLPTFLLGTLVGIAPGVIAIIFLGQTFVTLWEEYAYWIAGAGAALIAGYVIYHKRRNSANSGSKFGVRVRKFGVRVRIIL